MKYVDEYRDPEAARQVLSRIEQTLRGEWTIMEVCGGQTHSLIKHGLDQLLPAGIELIHGPGCPVCVTPITCLDEAIALAGQDNVIFCTFGDMLRVPGSEQDLLSARAAGADVRSVYSPLDAVTIARQQPDREVVFLAVGFETTAPANAMSVLMAEQEGLHNFSLLTSQVLVPPAIAAILDAPDNRVQGFLAAGHVCAVMGLDEYYPLVRRYKVPIVVTGFEPLDLLLGIESCIRQLEMGTASVDNQYRRSVQAGGNEQALACIHQVFAVEAREWRGLGELPSSGLSLKPAYRSFDARLKFKLGKPEPGHSNGCLAGDVLTGRIRPSACPHFGSSCTPEHPLGATMVSSEGACAAYYRYRREEIGEHA